MEIGSPAFRNGELIAEKYTCDGKDVSIPLYWKQPPKGTQSFALVMDDPDAPRGVWTHWVLYNIPAFVQEIPEGVPTQAELKLQGKRVTQGINSWGRSGYGGPCPPDKEHRYFFKLYALSQETNFPPGLTAAELEKRLKPILLERAEYMGVYDLKKRR